MCGDISLPLAGWLITLSITWSLAFVIGAWWGAAPRDRTDRSSDQPVRGRP